MMRFHHIAIACVLSVAAAGCAQTPMQAQPQPQAQTYGPQDEGRTFSDGTRVICEDTEVAGSTSDPNRIAGTAAGAVIGGLVGNQVGSGSGRRLATVGGAVAGGAVGRNVQGNRQAAQGETVVETRCWRGR